MVDVVQFHTTPIPQPIKQGIINGSIGDTTHLKTPEPKCNASPVGGCRLGRGAAVFFGDKSFASTHVEHIFNMSMWRFPYMRDPQIILFLHMPLLRPHMCRHMSIHNVSASDYWCNFRVFVAAS